MDLKLKDLNNYTTKDIIITEFTSKVFKVFSIITEIKMDSNFNYPFTFTYFEVADKENKYKFTEIQKAIDKYNSIIEN